MTNLRLATIITVTVSLGCTASLAASATSTGSLEHSRVDVIAKCTHDLGLPSDTTPSIAMLGQCANLWFSAMPGRTV